MIKSCYYLLYKQCLNNALFPFSVRGKLGKYTTKANVPFVELVLQQLVLWRNTLHLCMRNRNHINALFVAVLLHKMANWKHMCHMCLRGKHNTNAPFVTLLNFATSSLKKHILSAYEMLKLHKCIICNASIEESCNLKTHIAFVHEKKRLHKCTICSSSFALTSNLKMYCICAWEAETT